MTLTFTSCQSNNAESSSRAITEWVAAYADLPIRYADEIDWRVRYTLIEQGEIDVGWICGGPYVERVERGVPLQLLVAPVMAERRYRNRPVYFSDVVVRADSSFRSFGDLRGARWSINEPDSVSGCKSTAYRLALLGENWRYFGDVRESGGHHISLDWILDGEIDASAIDSTMLETELRLRPELADRIRIIDVFGPMMQPPWVIGGHVSAEIRDTLQHAMATMHTDPAGHQILADAGIARFQIMTDHDYDPIRRCLEVGKRAGALTV